MGLHRAGYEVLGIDKEPQPSYPFMFIQADALKLPVRLEDFDLIWASPPCQHYTIAQHIHRSGRRHPDLVPATREMLESAGVPWVMENVPGSPLRNAIVLCGRMFGLRVLRHRLFEASFLVMTPPHEPHPEGNLTNAHKGYSTGEHGFVSVAGNNFVREAGAKAMGIDWMKTRRELANAIPPAYSEYIAKFAQ